VWLGIGSKSKIAFAVSPLTADHAATSSGNPDKTIEPHLLVAASAVMARR